MARTGWLAAMGVVAVGCARVIGLQDLSFDRDAGGSACASTSCAAATSGTGADAGVGTGGHSEAGSAFGGTTSAGAGASGAPNGGAGGRGGGGGTVAFGGPFYLKPDVPVALARFGTDVALDGDTLVVGAPTEGDGTNTGPGSAYVFVRNGLTWQQQQRLPAPSLHAGDYFGWGVAVSGDTLVVGAPHNALDSEGVGAAYVYVRSNGHWTQQAELHVAEQELFDSFGVEVAITGDTAFVAAPLEKGPNSTAVNSGTVHVFTRSGTSWTHVGYFKAPVPGGSGLFGRHIAIDSGLLGIGAPGGAEFPGSGFIFGGSGATWTESSQFNGLDLGDYFGSAVALDNGTLAVGSEWEWSHDPSQTLSSGAVFVYVQNAGGWAPQAYLKATAPEAGAWFGAAVFLSGDDLFVGANRETVSGLALAGAVHSFRRTGDKWNEVGVIDAPNPDAADYFGGALAGDAHTLVVGANFEAGNGQDPADNSVYRAGAVYVMQR